MTNPVATIPVNIEQGQTTATLSLVTEDDDAVESPGNVIVTIVIGGTTKYTADSEKYYAVVTVTSEDLPLPPAPTKDGEPKSGLDSITLRWKAIDGAAKYRVIYGLATQKAGHGGTTIETAYHSLKVTGLACSSRYTFAVSAYGDDAKYRAAWGPPLTIPANTELCKLVAPTNLRVTPLPLRKAKLSWDAVPDAARYQVTGRAVRQVSAYTSGAAGCCPWHDATTKNGIVAGTEITILLDEVLVADNAYEFSVAAIPTNPALWQNSDGAKVIVIDSPIYEADGNSVGKFWGQAALKWNSVPGMVSGVAEGGDYLIVQRQLLTLDGSTDAKEAHAKLDWRPEKYEDNAFPSFATKTLSGVMTFLRIGEIYALQLIYQPPAVGGVVPTKVYSARDVFVWPAQSTPEDRVATFNSFGHWPNRRLNYTICDETFVNVSGTPLHEGEEWVSLIKNAAHQWQISSNGLVSLNPALSECNIHYFGSVFKDHMHNRTNEVYMVDTDDLARNSLMFNQSIPELSLYSCVLFADSCVISPDYYNDNRYYFGNVIDESVDMLINKQRVSVSSRPIDYPNLNQIRFNTCVTLQGPKKFINFELIMHEMGHMLGLSGFSVPSLIKQPFVGNSLYLEAHPSIADTIMNHDDEVGPSYKFPEGEDWEEPDCSPHPLDIMAIWALYQTVSR